MKIFITIVITTILGLLGSASAALTYFNLGGPEGQTSTTIVAAGAYAGTWNNVPGLGTTNTGITESVAPVSADGFTVSWVGGRNPADGQGPGYGGNTNLDAIATNILWGNGGATATQPAITITGLDPDSRYSVTVFSGLNNAALNYDLTVTGAGTGGTSFSRAINGLAEWTPGTPEVGIVNTGTGAGSDMINITTAGGNAFPWGVGIEAVDTSDPNIVTTPSMPFGDLTDLGAAPGPITRSITILNAGATQNLDLGLINISRTHMDLYAITTSPLPTTVPPGDDVQIEVVFTPAAEGGVFEAALDIASNDADTPSASVTLDAIVTSDPNIEIVQTTPLFGTMTFMSVPASITRRITVRNTGKVNTLNLSTPFTPTGTNAGSYAISEPSSIAPGEEADIDFVLSPAGQDGDYFASFDLESDDPDNSPVTISLDASIVIPDPAEIVAFYPFDNVAAPLADDSGVSGDATVGGGAPIYDAAGGFEGGYYLFNGLDRLTAPIDINPETLPKVTLGAWVRTDDLTPGNRKVMGHDDGAWDRCIGLDTRSGTFSYIAFTGANAYPTDTPGPTSTEDWAFLAATYDQDRAEVAIYVDIDASTIDDPLTKVSEDTTIGSGNIALSIGSVRPDMDNEGWIGGIDNFFVFSGILTDAQIEDLRNRGKAAIVGEDNFRITSIVRNSDGSVELTWNSDPSPGTSYTVLLNSKLSAPLDEWPDENDSVNSQGETTSYKTDPILNQDRMFFIIREN